MNYQPRDPPPQINNPSVELMQNVFHKSSSIPMLLPFAFIASLACAASKEARSVPGAAELPPAGPPLATAPQGVAGTASSTPSSTPLTPTTASSTASTVGNDSA